MIQQIFDFYQKIYLPERSLKNKINKHQVIIIMSKKIKQQVKNLIHLKVIFQSKVALENLQLFQEIQQKLMYQDNLKVKKNNQRREKMKQKIQKIHHFKTHKLNKVYTKMKKIKINENNQIQLQIKVELIKNLHLKSRKKR